jgi:hypothetical protein
MLKYLRAPLGPLRGARPAPARRRFRPGVECLEGRLAPATFTVTTPLDVVNPADGKLSLREAVSLANARPGPDTIAVPAGVYRLSLTGADDTNAAGDLDVRGSTLFRGSGAGATVIDGRRIDRVFDVLGSAPHSIQVTFQGLTIRNGLADDGGGGGIRVGNADLVVQGCAVTGNRASGAGGGISNDTLRGTGNITLVRSTVGGNVAGRDGGGLLVRDDGQGKGSVLTVSGSTIRRNSADNGGGIFAFNVKLTNSTVSGNLGQFGGGINASTITLTSSVVSGNSAIDGAGGLSVGTATLTNCAVSGNHSTRGDGGGIRGGTVNLTNCTVSGNSGGSGGGIQVNTATLIRTTVSGNFSRGFGGGLQASTATLTSCTVSGNTATFGGGGMECNTATLTRSTVSGNAAAGRNGGGISAGTVTLIGSAVSGNHAFTGGGGISATMATLMGSTVRDNTAGSDGGGITASTTATLTNSTVSGNFASLFGGGISGGTATLTGSTLSGNTASNGGGLEASRMTLTNCTVSGNTAIGGNGGGLEAGALTLLNVTVTDNRAHDGGGVFLAPGGTSSVRNSIIAGNLVDLTGTRPDVAGAFLSLGHNLIGDGSGSTGFVNGGNGDMVGTADDPIDPRLGPLANNGGPTRTHALLAGSPAIDHGDSAGAPATDQRGVARSRDGDGNGSPLADIGAFER